MTPSVGRVVHYVSYGTPGGEFQPACRAAIVTQVQDAEVVGLAVLNPTGLFFQSLVPAGHVDPGADRHPPGTWHWPERVDDPVAKDPAG